MAHTMDLLSFFVSLSMQQETIVLRPFSPYELQPPTHKMVGGISKFDTGTWYSFITGIYGITVPR